MNSRLRRWSLAAAAALAVCASLWALTWGAPTRDPDAQRDRGSTHASARARLTDVDSWAFALGADLSDTPAAVARRLGVFDLVVIDADEATRAQIEALRKRGTIVLGYLSVGTIEPWRPWCPRLRPFELDRVEHWDERYADVSEQACRTAILRIADSIADKGFDGLFLDNVDAVEIHPSLATGMKALVTEISTRVRKRGGLLFAQNADEFLAALTTSLDGWNREDVTFTYDFDTASYTRVPAAEHAAALAAIAEMKRAGAFVTTTDYLGTPGTPEEAEALRVASEAGALPYVSDVELTRIPKAPFRGAAE